MEIRIGGYLAASYLLEREPSQWHAIVMLDSGQEATDFVQVQTRSHLYLRFDDVEDQRPNKRAPSKQLIEEALAFARGKDKLLVCCRAGQARSVALAYVISCREYGVTEAFQLLNPTRHRPNRLVVALGTPSWELRRFSINLMNGADAMPIFDSPITTTRSKRNLRHWKRKARRTEFVSCDPGGVERSSVFDRSKELRE